MLSPWHEKLPLQMEVAVKDTGAGQVVKFLANWPSFTPWTRAFLSVTKDEIGGN